MALTKLLALTLAALLGIANAGTRFRDANDLMKLFKGPTADLFSRGPEGRSDLVAYVNRLKAKYGDRQIKAHIVAHTHDDVGWLKTVDEYFTGANDYDAHASVEYVLDTVIDELLADPAKKFTYVEMKFLSMWWKYQTEDMKGKVRQLVQSGRLDIVNAGWSMHDEACTHYEDIINNMYQGHKWFLQEFGMKPRIGWHVDPFGHSSTNPRLFAEMGLDAWFFSRIDLQDYAQRQEEKSLEWVWQPFSRHLGNSTQIFTHSNVGYCFVPFIFWFDDRFCCDSPTVSDPTLEVFNADEKTLLFTAWVYEQLDMYQGDEIFVYMGCDFTYANARYNFKPLDRFLKYFNDHVDNITVFYSTPGQYIDSLKQQNLSYPVRYDDMFPYADQENEYWTGYFTSRPNAKSQVRMGQANLHASNKMHTMRILDVASTNDLINQSMTAEATMLDSMGIYQHHDAVTGTAKQHVADDYSLRLHKSMLVNNPVYAKTIQDYFLSQKTKISSNQWVWCERLNGTYLDCPVSQNQKSDHVLVVHNPSLVDQKYLKLKVPHANWQVSVWDANGQNFVATSKATVICVPRQIEGYQMVNDCDLHIKTLVSAQNFTLVKLAYNAQVDLTANKAASNAISGNGEGLVFRVYDDQGVHFDLLKDTSGNIYKVAFDIMAYFSYQGQGAGPRGSTSGAYLFRPANDLEYSVRYTVLQNITTYNGGFIQEMFMNFISDSQYRNSTACVRLRYYDESHHSEWEVYLNDLPNDNHGREVTINWKSFDIKNNNTFWTDSNGLEMQKRILNYRETWNFSSYENVTVNYYPINTAISVVDSKTKFKMTVMNDRSQGGSVLEDGRIELMQNRRLFYDDDRGVEESLNETDQFGNGISTMARYLLIFSEQPSQASPQRTLQLTLDEPLQYFFAFKWNTTQTAQDIQIATDFEEEDPVPKQNVTADPVTNPFAVKYEVFPQKRNQIFIRVENIGDRFDTDDVGLSQNKTTYIFNLDQFSRNLFAQANSGNKGWNITNIIYSELALSGNQLYSESISSKTNWRLQGMNNTILNPFPVATNFSQIELVQQRIRMFNVTYIVSKSLFDDQHQISQGTFLY